MSKENNLSCPPAWLVPEDLLDQWEEEWHRAKVKHLQLSLYIAAQAAQWGADQELEACCEWLDDPELGVDVGKLRAARRPKPPSLKEQALKAVEKMQDLYPHQNNADTIRRALEQLSDD